MKRGIPFPDAAAVAFLLVVTFAFSGCLSSGSQPGDDAGMMHGVESEFQFLVEMIPHHQEAVDTALETAERTTRPELRTFARNVVRDQSGEIEMMRTWLAEWYPGKPTDADYRPMMSPTAGLSADRADRAFIEDMIMHHRMAVMMANQVITGRLSDRPEVLSLAEGIIRTQNGEIEQMEKWLSEWYGVENGNHMKH